MRRILTDSLAPGMVLAKPLYGADGKTLLATGMTLCDKYIHRLKELGVTYVYVETDASLDVEVEDVVSQQARLEAVREAKNVFDNCKVGRHADLGPTKKVINRIVDELVRNHNVLVNFIDMRAKNDYLFGHSVNVAILSVMTGISMEYDELRLRDLGVGAMLHDIGKLQVPAEILNKPGRLTAEEFEQIKQHPQYGFDMLRNTNDINLLSAHCAFQHHERWDGGGYPRKLKGSQIHEFAQIVAVSDVYDALTSDVVYRRAMPVCDALNIILKTGDTYFNPDIVGKFAENIALYPVGTVVRLSTGQLGIVVDVNKNSKTQPIVRIVQDMNQHPVNQTIEIDLIKRPQIVIQEVVEHMI